MVESISSLILGSTRILRSIESFGGIGTGSSVSASRKTVSLVVVAAFISMLFVGIGGASAGTSPFTDSWVGYPPSVRAELNDALSTKAVDGTGNAEADLAVTMDLIDPPGEPGGSHDYYEVGFTTTLFSHVTGKVGYSSLVGGINPNLWVNGNNVLSLADNGGKWVVLPSWYFPYYGAWYDRVFVSANGFILLGQSATDTDVETIYTTKAPSSTYPNNADPDGVIAPLWRNLNPASAGRVGYGWYLIGGYDTLVIAWEGVRNYANQNTQSFAIHIQPYNSGGLIRFVYKTLTKDQTTTVGIENPFGTAGVGDLYGQIPLPTSSLMSSVEFIPNSYNKWQITDVRVYAMKTYADVGGLDKDTAIRIQGGSGLGWGGLNVKLYDAGPSNPPPDFTDRTHRYINRVVDEIKGDIAGYNPVTGFLWDKYNYVKDLHAILTDYTYTSETAKDEPDRPETYNAMAENLPQNTMNPSDKVFHLWTAPVFKWQLFDDETYTTGGLAAHDHNIAFWAQVQIKRDDGSSFLLQTGSVSFTIAKSGLQGIQNGFYDNFDDGFIENPTFNPGSLVDWSVIKGAYGVVSISPQGLGCSEPYCLFVDFGGSSSYYWPARVVSPPLSVDFTRDYSIVLYLNLTELGRTGHLVVVDDGRLEVYVKSLNGLPTLCVATSTGYVTDRTISYGQWHMIVIQAHPSQGNFKMFVDSGGGMIPYNFKSSSGYTTIRMGSPATPQGNRDSGEARWDDVAVYGYLLPLPPNEAPTAVITGPSSGTTGQTLTFSGAGSSDPDGNIVSYSWNFGDGATATGVEVSHAWDENGAYTVALTVTDNDGATDVEQTTVSIANRPPTAVIAGPSSGTTGQTLTFSGSGSSDPDGTITAYSWGFGDGATASGVQVSHAYAGQGSYTVTLTVTDNDGATGTASSPVTIVIPNQPPVAAWIYTTADLTVNLDASSSTDPDGTIVSYQWYLGVAGGPGNQIGEGVSVSYTFTAAGTYDIFLVVTDDDGANDVKGRSVTTANTPPTSQWTWQQIGAKYVKFDGTGSSDPDAGDTLTYSWDFGDGTYGSVAQLEHEFASGGAYSVMLTVTDNHHASNGNPKTVQVTNAFRITDDSIVTTTADMAYDTHGYVHMVWSELRSGGGETGGYDVFYKRTNIFGEPTPLPGSPSTVRVTSSVGDDISPAVAVSETMSGTRIMIVWVHVNAADSAIQSIVWDSSIGGWGTTANIDYSTKWRFKEPDVTQSTTGVFNVVYRQVYVAKNTVEKIIHYESYTDSAVVIYTVSGSAPKNAIDRLSSPRIAWSYFGGMSKLHVVFSEGPYVPTIGAQYKIYYSSSSDGGATWMSQPIVLGTDVDRDWLKPRAVAIDAAGSLVCVVWEQDEGTNGVGVMLHRSLDGGTTWNVADRIMISVGSSGNRYSPDVSIGSSGFVYVVYTYSYGTSLQQIEFKQSSDNGGTWVAMGRVESTIGKQANPCIDVRMQGLGSDRILFVWEDNVDGDFDLYYSYKRNP